MKSQPISKEEREKEVRDRRANEIIRRCPGHASFPTKLFTLALELYLHSYIPDGSLSISLIHWLSIAFGLPFSDLAPEYAQHGNISTSAQYLHIGLTGQITL
jgi:hypothetical protein